MTKKQKIGEQGKKLKEQSEDPKPNEREHTCRNFQRNSFGNFPELMDRFPAVMGSEQE